MLRRLLERVLEGEIRSTLLTGEGYDVLFYSSARSAIHSYFRGRRPSSRTTKVLIPDYICNTVPLAIRASGPVEISTYPLDRELVPLEIELIRIIQKLEPDVLVIAPIFGAHGEAYDRVIRRVMALPRRPIVVLDAAQAMRPLPARMDAVVLSFGGKDVNGFHGGALLLDHAVEGVKPQRHELGFRMEYLYALYYFLGKWRPFQQPKAMDIADRGFMYADCDHLLGEVSEDIMSLASLSVAILEMVKLGRYRGWRRDNFLVIEGLLSSLPGVRIVRTENVSSSSHVPVEVEDHEALVRLAGLLDQNGLVLGRPYALDEDPSVSNRPYTYLVRNPFHPIRRGKFRG